MKRVAHGEPILRGPNRKIRPFSFANAQLVAQNTLKDPFIFDFPTLDKPFRERELEAGLVGHLERFLLELGAGFSFVGRQVHLDVAAEDFYK